MRACDVMSAPVVTVAAGTSVKDAAKLLIDHDFTALPVVDEDDRLIGIVTEVDLVRDRFPRDPRYRHTYLAELAELAAGGAPGGTVGAVMTAPVTALGVGADVVELVTVMRNERVRAIPIVDGATVVGIVTRRDLVRVLARDDAAIAADVRHRLANYAGPDRWTVRVRDGRVEISDEFDNATDRHVATVLAEAVPGVTSAHVVGPQRVRK
jgi:CBS-domain-containing membrane protein